MNWQSWFHVTSHTCRMGRVTLSVLGPTFCHEEKLTNTVLVVEGNCAVVNTTPSLCLLLRTSLYVVAKLYSYWFFQTVPGSSLVLQCTNSGNVLASEFGGTSSPSISLKKMAPMNGCDLCRIFPPSPSSIFFSKFCFTASRNRVGLLTPETMVNDGWSLSVTRDWRKFNVLLWYPPWGCIHGLTWSTRQVRINNENQIPHVCTAA